jgi:hypothetical protein
VSALAAMAPVKKNMNFIHVTVPLQTTLMVYRFRPRFRLPLSDHSFTAMPYGYHFSAPLSAITVGFPLFSLPT